MKCPGWDFRVGVEVSSSPWLYLVFVFIWKGSQWDFWNLPFSVPYGTVCFGGKRFVQTRVPLSRALAPAIPTLLEPHRDTCHTSSDFGGRGWSLAGSGGWGLDGDSRGVRTLSPVMAAGPVPGTERTVLTSTGGSSQGFGDAWICGVCCLAWWVGVVKRGCLVKLTFPLWSFLSPTQLYLHLPFSSRSTFLSVIFYFLPSCLLL